MAAGKCRLAGHVGWMHQLIEKLGVSDGPNMDPNKFRVLCLTRDTHLSIPNEKTIENNNPSTINARYTHAIICMHVSSCPWNTLRFNSRVRCKNAVVWGKRSQWSNLGSMPPFEGTSISNFSHSYDLISMCILQIQQSYQYLAVAPVGINFLCA